METVVILLKCNYHTGEMIIEKFKYKNEAEVNKRRFISSSGVNNRPLMSELRQDSRASNAHLLEAYELRERLLDGCRQDLVKG